MAVNAKEKDGNSLANANRALEQLNDQAVESR
jgi:hypothetical protein